MNNKKAFSLIEIIIATWVITISIFWIYKIIWENNKIINISNNSIISTTLLPIAKNCIENKSPSMDWYLSLWEDLNECNFNTDITLTNIDNIEYEIEVTNSWTFYEINIFSENIWNKTFQIKK